jgi:acyl-CoA reductase-like NAD-dependent aldehyde dehydrogenase
MPKGLIGVCVGAGHVGHQVVTHPLVDAVLFIGSHSTGVHINKATAHKLIKVCLSFNFHE